MEEEEEDLRVYGRKGKSESLKKKLLPSLFAEDPESELKAEKVKKAAKSKKRKRTEEEDQDETEEIKDEESEAKKAKKKKKKKKKKTSSVAAASSSTPRSSQSKSKKGDAVHSELKQSDARMEAYLQKPNQLRRKASKQKYKVKA